MEAANKCELLPNPARIRQDPPMPTTTRGAPSILNVHPKEPKIIYCSGKLVIIRNLADDKDCFIYRGHKDRTTAARFSPNGYWVASGDVSGKVRIWSYDHPEHMLKIEVPVFAGEIKDIAWGPESKRLIAVGDGRGMMARVFMWDTGNNIGEIVGHQKRILSCDYKPTRPYRIMTASEDTNVCCFEGPPFKFLQNLTSQHSNFVNCIRYSPDGSKAVSVGQDKKICVYDGKTGDLLDAFGDEHGSSIYSVCWSPDGKQLLTSSGDKTVKLWDFASKAVKSTFSFSETPELGDMQVSVAWTGEYMVSLSLNGNINYLDWKNPSKPSRVLYGHQINLTSIDVIPGTQDVITGCDGGRLCISKGNEMGTVVSGAQHSGKIAAVAASKDSCASAGWDDTIRFATGTPLAYTSSAAVNGQPVGIALHDSTTVVATVKGVTLFRSGSQVCEVPTPSWNPSCVALSPDGTEVVLGSKDDTKLHFFKVDGNSLVASGDLEGHRGNVTTVEYSPDGSLLAAGDAYREVRVWDAASRTPKVQGMWVHHTTRVMSVTWSPDGLYVASGSLDEHIYVWNVARPMKKCKFEFAHKDGVTGVKYIAEDILVSIGNDGCRNTWKITPP